MRKFLEESTDTNSVYQQVLKESRVEKELVFSDLIAFLVGGHESSARVLTNAMFYAKKYPECHTKLMEEINRVML